MKNNNLKQYVSVINKIVDQTDLYKKLFFNHQLHINLYEDFLLFEQKEIGGNLEKRGEAIIAIENDDFEKHNPSAFRTALMKTKYPEMLTMYSVEEFDKMKLFKLNGFDIGYALKQRDDGNGEYDEIVSVFNNEPDIKQISVPLVNHAIAQGGRYLDHFDGFLSKLYGDKLGFKVYNRDKFDPQYDPDGSFRDKYGALDIVYRKLD